jgi:hypothetical protein
MPLSKQEKNVFIVPIVFALLILGLVGYNRSLSSQNRAFQELITKNDSRISQDQENIRALQQMGEKENFYLRYRLDDWIPFFENPLEVKLFLTQKVRNALSLVGGKEKSLGWKSLDSKTQPHQTEFTLEAVFPSYTALLEFVEAMEKGKPSLLPKQLGVNKTDIELDVSLSMVFNYRLKDETA